MTKLSDTQAIILSEASRHEALLASAPKLPAAARQAVFRSMLKNLLLEEVPAPAEHRDIDWRQNDEGNAIALRITADGLRAIGIEPEAASDIGTEPRELTEAEEAEELALQQDALDADNRAEEAPSAAAPTQKGARGRQGLREAAKAAVAAWKAQDDLTPTLMALAAVLGRAAAREEFAAQGQRNPREGTKQETVLTLLRREEGATIAQVMEATGWQQHTVRGFFAGLKRKGVSVEVLERVKQVGAGHQGTKGSYSIYRVASPAAG